MKRIYSLFLTSLLLVLLYSANILAFDMNIAPDDDLSGGIVTGFGYERGFRLLENQTLSCPKDDLTKLYDTIALVNEFLYCTVDLPDTQELVTTCRATWNTRELPLDTPGAYKLIATLAAPKGCSFGDGVRTQIVIPVQILDEVNPVEIIRMANWVPYSLAAAVPQHGALEDLTSDGLFQDFTTNILRCVDEYDSVYYADVSWDFSSLRFDKPGIYTITGTPLPPEGTVFADNLILPQPTATVSVQALNQPDINCFYLLYPDMRFPWIAPDGDLDSVTIWLSEDGNPWKELTSTHEAAAVQDYIRLNLSLFQHGRQYQLQVDHPHGQTGIFSFLWDDTIEIGGYWGGDRDGGDSDTLPPPNTVKPPANTAKPPTNTVKPPAASDKGNSNTERSDTTSEDAPSPLPATGDTTRTAEEITDTTTTISGERLDMMQQEGGISFSKQGVHVLLSKKAIDSLPLRADSIFTIEIRRENERHFSFSVWVDGILATDMMDTKVTLPYTPDNDNSILLARHNVSLAESTGNYDKELKLASFIVDSSGSYTLQETTPHGVATVAKPQIAKTQAHAKIRSIIMAALFIALLLITGGILITKRRRR